MTHISLFKGAIIRQLENGEEYEVLGNFYIDMCDMADGQDVHLVGYQDFNDETLWALQSHKDDSENFRMSVRFKASETYEDFYQDVVLYRALDCKRGEPWLFARPGAEFTPDRFEKLSD